MRSKSDCVKLSVGSQLLPRTVNILIDCINTANSAAAATGFEPPRRSTATKIDVPSLALGLIVSCFAEQPCCCNSGTGKGSTIQAEENVLRGERGQQRRLALAIDSGKLATGSMHADMWRQSWAR